MRHGRSGLPRVGLGESETSYLESVGDLMSGLLFVFILTMAVFAILFQQQRDVLAETARVQQQAVAELTEIDNMRRQLLESLAKSLKERGVQIQVDLEQGVLRLPESILFPSGSADLTPAGERAVRILGEELGRVLPCFSAAPPRGCDPVTAGKLEVVLIEGHTDNAPIRNAPFPDNWSLSAARSITTYRALIQAVPALAQLKNPRGVPIFGVSGYADQRPVADNQTEAGKRLNRRIDLRFIMTAPAPEVVDRPRAGN